MCNIQNISFHLVLNEHDWMIEIFDKKYKLLHLKIYSEFNSVYMTDNYPEQVTFCI